MSGYKEYMIRTCPDSCNLCRESHSVPQGTLSLIIAIQKPETTRTVRTTPATIAPPRQMIIENKTAPAYPKKTPVEGISKIKSDSNKGSAVFWCHPHAPGDEVDPKFESNDLPNIK